MALKPLKKLKLQGFNNLTKTLSFNIYDVCYARTERQRHEYIRYIDERYNAERLTAILTHVARIIGANILNVARQDYEPQGASVTMLIAEDPVETDRVGLSQEEAPGPRPGDFTAPAAAAGDGDDDLPWPRKESVVAHLDKSHITVHTYPEAHPDNGIATFRADLDVSTCGRISPLKALNYLIHSFESDILTIDYRVRGFTRDVTGKKFFIDHKIHSIQNFIDEDVRDRYQLTDVNVYQENIFHTKMLINAVALDNYLFGLGIDDLDAEETEKVGKRVRREMLEIFYGKKIKK